MDFRHYDEDKKYAMRDDRQKDFTSSEIPVENKSREYILTDIRSILKEQNGLLQTLVERQLQREFPVQPIYPVPARSSSAWNALLASFIRNTEPMFGRWRGGLDTLLIFVGFFSSIVASFLVESSKNLKVDETARTNELLTNLTEIIVAFQMGSAASRLPIVFPRPFVPDPADVRVNVYWYLALILSISAAALAVAGRGFLELLTRLEGDAATKLTDIYRRRKQAKLILGPILESLPQLLIIPFILFVIGLLDSLLSSSLSASKPVVPTLAASVISCIIVAIAGILLLGAIIHAIIYPESSPFQTTLSKYFSRRRQMRYHRHSVDINGEQSLSNENKEVFHLALQETYEDDYLDQASAALEGIISSGGSVKPYYGHVTPLTDLEVRTILHLLSPEASLRSNISAARLVYQIDFSSAFSNTRGINIPLRSADQVLLLFALLRAANRDKSCWPPSYMIDSHSDSIFIKAIASLIPVENSRYNLHPFLILLLANYRILQPLPPQVTEAYKATVWYAVTSLAQTLPRRRSIARIKELDNVLLRIFGPCIIDPPIGVQLLCSFMNEPTLLTTTYQDSVDYETVVECMTRWLATGKHATETITQTINIVQLENVGPQWHSTQRADELYQQVVHVIFRYVLHALQSSSQQSLTLCTTFILASRETFIWEQDKGLTLQFILRFLDIFEDNMANIPKDKRVWKTCRNTLQYVYQWLLYRATPFPVEIETIWEFQRTIPPRKELIAKICFVWTKFNEDVVHCDMLPQAVIPLPLEDWESVVVDDISDIIFA